MALDNELQFNEAAGIERVENLRVILSSEDPFQKVKDKFGSLRTRKLGSDNVVKLVSAVATNDKKEALTELTWRLLPKLTATLETYRRYGTDDQDLFSQGILSTQDTLLNLTDRSPKALKTLNLAEHVVKGVISYVEHNIAKQYGLEPSDFHVVEAYFDTRDTFEEATGRKPNQQDLKALTLIAEKNHIKPPDIATFIQVHNCFVSQGELDFSDQKLKVKEKSSQGFQKDELEALLAETTPEVLDSRSQRVFLLRYGLVDKQMTYEKIGRTLNVTTERVRQIENKSIQKLKRHLRSQASEANNKEDEKITFGRNKFIDSTRIAPLLTNLGINPQIGALFQTPILEAVDGLAPQQRQIVVDHFGLETEASPLSLEIIALDQNADLKEVSDLLREALLEIKIKLGIEKSKPDTSREPSTAASSSKMVDKKPEPVQTTLPPEKRAAPPAKPPTPEITHATKWSVNDLFMYLKDTSLGSRLKISIEDSPKTIELPTVWMEFVANTAHIARRTPYIIIYDSQNNRMYPIHPESMGQHNLLSIDLTSAQQHLKYNLSIHNEAKLIGDIFPTERTSLYTFRAQPFILPEQFVNFLRIPEEQMTISVATTSSILALKTYQTPNSADKINKLAPDVGRFRSKYFDKYNILHSAFFPLIPFMPSYFELGGNLEDVTKEMAKDCHVSLYRINAGSHVAEKI